MTTKRVLRFIHHMCLKRVVEKKKLLGRNKKDI